MAEVWGSLDTDIDGRIDNPVTNPADLEGFHKLEMLMWDNDTLTGASSSSRAAGLERTAAPEVDRNSVLRSRDHGERGDRSDQRSGHGQDHR